jgi:hypothetical protein
MKARAVKTDLETALGPKEADDIMILPNQYRLSYKEAMQFRIYQSSEVNSEHAGIQRGKSRVKANRTHFITIYCLNSQSRYAVPIS